MGGHKERRVDHSEQVADAGLCPRSEQGPEVSLYREIHPPPAALGPGGTQKEQPARMGKVKQD